MLSFNKARDCFYLEVFISSFKLKFTTVLTLTSMVFLYNNCGQTEFSTEVLDSNILQNGNEVKISNPEPKAPVQISKCNLNVGFQAATCVVFRDSFERSDLVAQNDFNWDLVILDNPNGGNIDVDAQIHSEEHLGPIVEGQKAVLFSGREGGSTHEIYLVSKAFDLSSHDKALIQFKYLPIGLEGSITLGSGEVLPESIRIDVCTASDYECGLTGSDRHQRLKNNWNWEQHFFRPLESGGDLNLRDYFLSDWKFANLEIDLSHYTQRSNAKFVFRISVAMDEGYIRNDSNRLMEDGIILDDVNFIAIKN